MPGFHSLLSPSGASRWMKCLPSARFEAEFPETDNDYSREGTLAHFLAEILIKKYLGRIPKKEFDKSFAKVLANDLYKPEMKAYCDNYATAIIEKFNGYGAGALIYTEQEVDLEEWIPEGKGHVDISIVHERILDINDLKYGKGVPVDAENNAQLKCYALGAYLKFSLMFDIDTVRMSIYQPRIENNSTWEISVGRLMAWADTDLRYTAEKAFKGEGEFVAGEHCRFCRARPRCKAIRNWVNEQAIGVFDIPLVNGILEKENLPNANTLEPEEVAKIILAAGTIESWIKSVKDYALDQATKHFVQWPDLKLVEGRSNRVITKVEEAIDALKASGYKTDQFLSPRELFGITKLTAEMGTPDFNRILDKFIIKPKGSPTLAHKSDKREEYSKQKEAEKAFENIDLKKFGIEE